MSAPRPWPFGRLIPFSFDVVMADPPWPWATYSAKGQAKSPEAQYSTMSMDEIAALPVGDCSPRPACCFSGAHGR